MGWLCAALCRGTREPGSRTSTLSGLGTGYGAAAVLDATLIALGLGEMTGRGMHASSWPAGPADAA